MTPPGRKYVSLANSFFVASIALEVRWFAPQWHRQPPTGARACRYRFV